jgi:hypothetical protein
MSTVRFFLNNKRVSTAVHLENGTLLQVYPEHRRYENQAAWEQEWNESSIAKPKLHVQTTPAKPKSDKPRKPREKPLCLSTDYEVLEEMIPKRSWTCPACRKGQGNDHRMCISTHYNYSVIAWEHACGIRS